ncbi:MAG: hypothetical protein ACKVT2_07545 [Saprospiraceae bacterium]
MKGLFFNFITLAIALFAMPQHAAAQSIKAPALNHNPAIIGKGAYNPPVYHRNKDAAGKLAVNYGMFIPMLTESVKEQKSDKDLKITELESRLAEKDHQINALEIRMAKLEALVAEKRE